MHEKEKRLQLLQDNIYEPKTSPERTFQNAETSSDRPGLVTNINGTSWSGMMRGQAIIDNDGETHGDTDIKLDNTDTRERVDRAKKVLEGQDFYNMSLIAQIALMDQFAQRIHQSDVVGSYFPAVTRIKAQQDNLKAEGASRVLSEDQKELIAGLREAQVAQNTAQWSRRDDNGVVEDAAVQAVEENNTDTTLAILQIERDAAYEVLGQEEASRIENEARRGIHDLSDIDVERRVVASLMDQASEAKLTKEEKAELENLKAEEDRLWDEKHQNQTDFADAIRDGNPDCSEYASLTAVSLTESGINNVRVMGHVVHDSDFPMVGAHAYNVILDESGQNVIGVFEGTATSGTFKKVMKPVSLQDFENGATLVTYNNESGWSTYGTGSPAQGRDFMDFVDNPDAPGQQDLVCNIIEQRDVSAMGKAKMDYVQSLNPEVVADQIIGIYNQYGDAVKVQGWIDGIRDGLFPGDDNNPAFAQAAQILHDYDGPMPPPPEIRARIVDIVDNAQDRALNNNNYDLAITPEVLHKLEGPVSRSMARDLKVLADKMDDLSAEKRQELLADKPWLTRVEALSDKIGDVSSLKALDISIDQGDSTYADQYEQIASIVRQHDVNQSDLSDIRQAVYEQNYAQSYDSNAVLSR